MPTPADNARFDNPNQPLVDKPGTFQSIPPTGRLQDVLQLLRNPPTGTEQDQYIIRAIASLSMEDQRSLFTGQVPVPPERGDINGATYGEWIQNTWGPSVQQYRGDQYKEGKLLPGVDETGAGTNLSPAERANALAANNIQRGEEILRSLSEDPGAYTWDPTMDQGAGYNVQDKYKQMGTADPLQLEYQTQAIDQTRSNTAGRDAQGRSLSELDQIIQEGGLTAIDRARMARSNEIRGTQARGAEQAIMADAEEQGRGGGTQSTMGRLMARQNQARMQASDDLETQAMALGRRDQAIGQQAAIGGQVQSAQDVIDNFNTMGKRDMEAARVAAINQGREATWGENNKRNAIDTGTYNGGVNMQFAEDSGRATRNAATSNQADAFNAGPNQGARGAARDVLGVSQLVSGDANAGASLLGAQGAQASQLSADQAAQQNAAITGAIGLPANLIAAYLGGQ